jgi:hypothetical protein
MCGLTYEDNLPKDFPYDACYPYSRVVDGVRMFPFYGSYIYWGSPEDAQKAASPPAAGDGQTCASPTVVSMLLALRAFHDCYKEIGGAIYQEPSGRVVIDRWYAAKRAIAAHVEEHLQPTVTREIKP